MSLLYYTYHLEFCFQTSVFTRWLFTKWNLSKLQQRYYFSRLFFIFKQNKRYFYAQVAELLPPSSRLHVARVRHAAHTSSVWVAAGPTMKREPGVCSLSVGRPSAGWKQCCAVSLIKKGIGVSEKSRSACEQSIRAHQAAARTIVSRDSHHAFLVCLPTVSPSSHTSPVLSTPPPPASEGRSPAQLCANGVVPTDKRNLRVAADFQFTPTAHPHLMFLGTMKSYKRNSVATYMCWGVCVCVFKRCTNLPFVPSCKILPWTV